MRLLAPCSIVLLQLVSFGLTALPIAQSTSAQSLSLNEALNFTANLNSSQSNLLDIPLPSVYIVPDSDVILTFDGFRGRLFGYAVTLCLLKAANEASMHFGSTAPMERQRTLQYYSGGMRLKLYAGDPDVGGGLTWGLWAAAIRGLSEVMTEKYSFQDVDFYIWKGAVKIGGGLISDQL